MLLWVVWQFNVLYDVCMLVLKEVFHLYANILFNFCAFNYYIICALINSVLHYHAFSIFGYYSYDDKWEGFEIYSYWNTFRLFFICKELRMCIQ